MEDRIARGFFQGRGVGDEFIRPAGLARAEGLLRTVGTHHPPLVVIPAQPYLGDIGERPVLGYFPGGEMAVVVEDGKAVGLVVKQAPGAGRIQKKILVHECFHCLSFPAARRNKAATAEP
ncbi:hypothetical protein SDC9_16620 [bioreactor metagenome]|uniref:Uncharacterized protein n=1 Tax=bioreactor metagenome TaxID=1076179 RepID=A0A644TV34_9ZZZZ